MKLQTKIIRKSKRTKLRVKEVIVDNSNSTIAKELNCSASYVANVINKYHENIKVDNLLKL